MKVCIGSAGPFHTFDLARQMARRGYLERLYTAYPAWKVEGLPREKVSAFPWVMGPAMLANHFGLSWVRDRLNLPLIDTFDRWMAERLEPCGIFHCLSSFGLQSHRAARARYGALTVCDRGSSHIVFQDEILHDEYERLGMEYAGIDRRVVERELEEYRSCDLVFVGSTFALRTFIEQGVPREKLRLNPYGVDLAMFRPAPRRDRKFRVLFAGTVSVQKGVHYLVEAVEAVGGREIELCAVGSVEPEMRPFVARHSDRLRHLGSIPRAQLFEHYSQASVLVLPSVQDGFGMVLAEAMACGVPVIATENTGLADLITDGVEGFIVPIRDAAAIAAKIQLLRDDPARREQMAGAALARVRAIGGWDDYGVRAAEFYRQALAARGGARDAHSVR